MSNDSSIIKVGIRGMAGSLGTSIHHVLPRQKDMSLALGVVRDDSTFKRFLRRRKSLTDYPDQLAQFDSHMPRTLALDDERVSASISRDGVTLVPMETSLLSSCDIVLDCATPGTFRAWNANHYSKLDHTLVVSQAGEFSCPGHFISPPSVHVFDEKTRIFRLGDCIVCALVPVISVLVENFGLTNVRLAITTQFTGSVDGTPTSDVADAIHFTDAAIPQKKKDLYALCKTDIDIVSYNQVVGLRFYDVRLTGKINSSNASDVRQCLIRTPRVRVANGISGTDDLVALRRSLLNMGLNLPPITVSGGSGNGSTDSISLHVSIDHQSIAACANLDTIRILCGKLNPFVAMEVTDYWMSYKKFDSLSDAAKEYVKKFE